MSATTSSTPWAAPGAPEPGGAGHEGTGHERAHGAAGPAGDRAAGGGRGRSWWHRHRMAVLVLAGFAALLLLAYAVTGRASTRPLAPDNAEPAGARAAAVLLREQGVRVQEATTLAEAGALAGPESTVLVTDVTLLSAGQRADLLGTGADLVVVGATYGTLEGLGAPVTPSGAGSADPVQARCADPDAHAASRLAFSRGSVTAEPGSGVVVCFPVGKEGAGAYAVWEHGNQTVRYLADARVMTNEHLAQDGNAALTLRMLGHHENLVWYLPSALDASAGIDDVVPGVPVRAQLVLLMLAVAVAVLALGRGRAMGRVVTEVMPVVVRSAETTRGRGRLYRRSRAYDHAAAALRAGAANRLAGALGLPRSAGAETLVDAVARATGRGADELGALLYGPPPTGDAALLALSTALDTLESEVHRS
ncbi:DUF4350 domain-containing protein [Georgenia sp. SYP-B2076]|uniref:DUF4350 domain-containing protein n=1 Tax=Georgenia sp. SYP-B2076 TaxID=2495881 RepID=UPI000F8E8DBD|nr:DUF4350 domain-containing protein [Georgenia sp. SYP-B2076]